MQHFRFSSFHKTKLLQEVIKSIPRGGHALWLKFTILSIVWKKKEIEINFQDKVMITTSKITERADFTSKFQVPANPAWYWSKTT